MEEREHVGRKEMVGALDWTKGKLLLGIFIWLLTCMTSSKI